MEKKLVFVANRRTLLKDSKLYLNLELIPTQIAHMNDHMLRIINAQIDEGDH